MTTEIDLIDDPSRRRIIFGIAAVAGAAILPACQPPNPDRSLTIAVPSGPEGAALTLLAAKYQGPKVIVAPYPYETLRQKLSVSLASAQAEFDAVLIDDPWFPLLSRYLQELKGVSIDLLSDLVVASLDLCKDPYKTGTLKALPFVGNTQLLFVRRDRMPYRERLPDLPSWADVVNVAKAISAEGRSSKAQYFGYAIRGRAGAPIVTDFLPLYWSHGGQLTQESTGRTVCVVEKSKLSKALMLYQQLSLQSPQGANSFDWNEMTSAFEDGTAAMQLNWPIAIDRLTKKLGPPGKGMKWDVVPPPGEGGSGTSMIGNWLLAVPQNTPKAADASAFIAWLLSQQATVAGPLTPPTRSSVFQALSATTNGAYMATIRQALERSTARDRTHRWGEIEDIVSAGTQKVVAGTASPEESATAITEALQRTFPA